MSDKKKGTAKGKNGKPKEDTTAKPNGSDTQIHEIVTSEILTSLLSNGSKGHLVETRHLVEEHSKHLDTEISKLSTSRILFEKLRSKKELSQSTSTKQIMQRLEDGKNMLQGQVLELHKQNDRIEIENMGTQHQTLEELRSQVQSLKAEHQQKEELKDQEFRQLTTDRNQEIQTLVEKVKKAKQDIQEYIDLTITNRLKMCEKLDDLSRQVEGAKDPKYYPDTLRQAEKENKDLLCRLQRLLKERQGIDEDIKTADENNDLVEKQVKELSQHKDVNHQLIAERDSILEKITTSTDKQKQLYEDNIEKLRKLKDLDIKIQQQDKNTFLLLRIVELLKQRISFDVKDLDERIRILEDGIITIDHGTQRMDSKVNNLKSLVDNNSYLDALDRIQTKIKTLNSKNHDNSDTKDGLRQSVSSHEEKITKMDPSHLTIEELRSHQSSLSTLSSQISTSEATMNTHMEEYEKLINEMGCLKSDIQSTYEQQIKAVQKKDEIFITETNSLLTTTKDLLDSLTSKIENDNPYMKRFTRKLNSAREKYTEYKSTTDCNIKVMHTLATREVGDQDYLHFIVTLCEDQAESDFCIENIKKGTEGLLKTLESLRDELEESDRGSKDEILAECKRTIQIRMKKLPNLEQKLKSLETGVTSAVRQTDLAVQILDKENAKYQEVLDLDKELKHLEKDTDGYRKEKDRLGDQLEKLFGTLKNSETNILSMNDIVNLQKECDGACQNHDQLEGHIDDGLDKLKKLQLSLDQLLQVLRDELKSETDKVVQNMDEKLDFLNKFLNPQGKVADSIQRPTYLKELLEETYILRDDPAYPQYHTYTDLVTTNLTKCSYASTDLKRLSSDISKPLKDHKSPKSQSTIDQIDTLQNTLKTLSNNSGPAQDLTDVVKGILGELGQEKEEEIREFLNGLRSGKLEGVQQRYAKCMHDLSELVRRYREVNDENEGFTLQLNKATDKSNSKQKVTLIETLLRECSGSQRDLKKIKTEADEITITLERYDFSRISLKEIHSLLRDLEQYDTVVSKKLSELETIDEEIEERKRRWRDYLTTTEAKEKIVRELLSLIPLLREKYDRMVKSHTFCTNSLNGFFLVNQMIQECEYYETNETPCLNREQVKLQLGDLGNNKDQYLPQVERLESYDKQKLKNVSQEEIEKLIIEATSIIKTLDVDNQALDEVTTYLREERKDLKDADVYNNQRRIDRLLAESDERLQSIIHEFEGTRETLINSDISDPRLNHKIKEIESHVVSASEIIDRARSQFEIVCKEIDREDMNTIKLTPLGHVIEKLGVVSKDLHELTLIYETINRIFKDLQDDLVDLYYSKKLNELYSLIRLLLDRLSKLDDLIYKLIQLAKEFTGYTSDNEEEDFVKDLQSELNEVKDHHKETETELISLEKQVKELQEGLEKSPQVIDEEKADKIDSNIAELSKMIENIERLVDSKIQRFADMDPYKKFRRREKELNKLNTILAERENILKDLKQDCFETLHNEQASDELKEVATEVVEEIESLEDTNDNLKQRLNLLGNEIDTYLEKSAKTEMTIEEIFELLYANVEIKKKLKLLLEGIDEFSKALSENRKKYLLKKAESPPKINYKATKGDEVDEMLGNWINTHGCEIEIRRLGGGFYMFGEKKIFAKIINGKLIIRVGGGYMNIDEFMKHYGMMELARQQRVYEMEYESLNYDDILSTEEDGSQPADRHSVMGIAQAKKGLRGSFGGSFVNKKKSMVGGSPKAARAGHRHGSPSSSFVKKTPKGGSPRTNNSGSPRATMVKSFRRGEMPSAAKIEESLRKMEQDAKEGKLKEGYSNLTYKK